MGYRYVKVLIALSFLFDPSLLASLLAMKLDLKISRTSQFQSTCASRGSDQKFSRHVMQAGAAFHDEGASRQL